MKVETEPMVVYNLPPSLKPIPSQSVTAFRQVEPAAIPAEVAALLAMYETFLNILQQCPLDPSWPAELYRNVLSMISYCEFKWYWADISGSDFSRPEAGAELDAFAAFSDELRRLLKQVREDCDRGWAEYESIRFPDMSVQ